jgi:hypothetical protein
MPLGEPTKKYISETPEFETNRGLVSVIKIGELAERCSNADPQTPELTNVERAEMAEYLQQNSEVETYESFKPGDTVVTFTSTSLGEEYNEDGSLRENIYSAKWMNDNISHEFVNGLAQIRDFAISNVYGDDVKVVTSSFKLCSARVCNEAGENPEGKLGELNSEYISMIEIWAEEYLKNNGLSENQRRSLNLLIHYLNTRPDIGLACGKAKVEEKVPFDTEMDHYRNVRLALVQSTIEAKVKDLHPEDINLSFKEGLLSDRAYALMEDTESLARKYFDKTLRDRFGREYRPFHVVYDDSGMYYQMDHELAFALRKGEFRPDSTSFQQALELRAYLRMVNALDVVSYHTEDDLDDPEFCDSIQQRNYMIALLMSGKKLDSEDLKLAGKLLSENLLFHNIQSSAVFHRILHLRLILEHTCLLILWGSVSKMY